MKRHTYKTDIAWTGNIGEGTSTYRSYRRDHAIAAPGKPEILASSDPAFRGDPARYNPEELLVASLSSCHMLSYLHLCAVNGVTVMEYHDSATGVMEEGKDGSGQLIHVVLRPEVKVSPASDAAKAASLHAEAHHYCFIARSVNFPVEVEPNITA